MLIRREQPADEVAIRELHNLAFRQPDAPSGASTVESVLVDDLRSSSAWIPPLSLVGVQGGDVIGHVLCTRAALGEAPVPVLGLAPLAVRPDHQGHGVGHALMHAVIAAADALGEPLIALLGEPDYYARFGFKPAADHGVESPDPAWAAYFQVRRLSAYEPTMIGRFKYADAFDRLSAQ